MCTSILRYLLLKIDTADDSLRDGNIIASDRVPNYRNALLQMR